MALKGQTAYYTARQCVNGNRNFWKVYRIVKDSPEYPGVQYLEEAVSKPVMRDRAMQLVGELMSGVTTAQQVRQMV